MTSIIKLHTLSGAMDESPPCYLLQIDEVRILLDCGWDEKFDPNFIKDLKKHVNVIDAVLLSYPDGLHLGALPYLVGKLGLNCPIYATIPVYKMGQMFMYDLYMSHYNMYDFDLFSLDDVDAAFDKIIQIKYNQTVSLKGKGYGIVITPLQAAHMVGGTIWKIVKDGEEDIIYAVDYNHKKERHLNSSELVKFQRPSLLITDAFNANYQQARRRARDEKLMTNILQTVRNNGNVLIAVDTAGRVLELGHMLDQLWKNKESGLMAYSLILLNNVSYNVIEFAKSQIEWMSDKLMRSFEGARNNPFQFKHVQFCHNLNELLKLSSPKVVLASSPDLECGFSRELFVMWSSNPNNSIILTSRSSSGTLGYDLLENGGNGRKIEIDFRKRVELQGNELEEYLRSHNEKVNSLIETLKVDKCSSESEDEIEVSVITGRHDIVLRSGNKQSIGFFKSNNKHHVIYPFYEEKMKCDEYGEIINSDEFRILDSMDAISECHVEENAEEKAEDLKLLENPTKCICSRKLIEVNAQIQFIDFEGRSDGESVMKILSQLRPRRVVIVRGQPHETKALANHCQQNIGAKVFTPGKGDIIDVTSERHIYQIRLTDGLLSQLQFQKCKTAEVAWIDAHIDVRFKQIDSTRVIKDKQERGDSYENEKCILNLQPFDTDEIPIHNIVLINELRLSDFKQYLMRNNTYSEFSNGILWCNNGTLALRRVDTGTITFEGCLSEEYYKIRNCLYEQYSIV